MSGFEILGQQIVNGLSVGLMYGLVAIGLTLIYGIMELINFAHFSVFIVGAFAALEMLSIASRARGSVALAMSDPGSFLVLLLVMLGVTLVTGGLGALVQRMLRVFRGTTGTTGPMIASLGIAYVLSNAILLAKGPQNFAFPIVIPPVEWSLGRVQVRLKELLVALACITQMLVVYLLVWKTRLGRAMRATRDDAEAAQMMGVEVDTVFNLVFIGSSALAGIAGLIFGAYYGQINFFSGYGVGLRAFTAAVLGGIGNPFGSVLGGILIGLIEAVGGQVLGVQWTQIIVFSVLIASLVFLPNGLLGAQIRRRA